ncbi:CDP-glycerol glycerophosphotransferase family protein [Atopobium sp. oral taxon 810]|uniref:CDP-glycerol glycerophosphotransferase family protein n=1 Tax=Atopobium sp. oral taxon 810 TaxID=712158 RepID=UPI000397B882|nr:CDP-glycerol glycerophosphotransferase family protein [Atopobium sp. oral taxon 810]ERI04569.1 CDP-glycerol:poly(glycerophosphate) glycerophosphotransferase [Atopobium sp. oral taxon 810 str. F0209]
MNFYKDAALIAESVDFVSTELARAQLRTLVVEVSCEEELLQIRFPREFDLRDHMWLYLIKREKVLWAQELTDVVISSHLISLDLRNCLRYFCENDIRRASFGLLVSDQKGDQFFSYSLSLPLQSNTSYCDYAADYYPSLITEAFHEAPYPTFSHQVGNESALAVTPYAKKGNRTLSLLASWEDEVPSNYLFGKLLSLSCGLGGKVSIQVAIPKTEFSCSGLELVYRSVSEVLVHELKVEIKVQVDRTIISTSFFPDKLGVQEIYWDFFVTVSKGGKSYRVYVKVPKKITHRFILHGTRVKLPDGLIFFPYATAKAGRLAFTCRPSSIYDSFATRMRSLLAVLLAPVVKEIIGKRNIWLVYEKFCSLAEDNGYYFFRYCMDELPTTENKDIYYVIDKNASAYAKLKKYGRHILNFMGFRHLLYSLLANLYIGSDSSQHLYQWRAMPNIIQSRMRKKDMLFLQHGVIAMKRVDKGFGASNSSPIKYFLTSSEAERQIIVDYFGYAKQQVAVLGLSRWDVIENHADIQHPMILVMPTWRPWLEEQSMDVFTTSEYFRAYSQLLHNEHLQSLLEEYDASLYFFIHPKINEFTEAFQSDNVRIHLVPLGQRPLNELIMECSMLVTDYSSVCWDVLYQNKPVVYYQFDQADFLEYVGSYIDFNTDLPGSMGQNVDETVQAIEEVLDNKCVALDENLKKANQWYAYRDKENRARTYRFIKKQGY